MKMKQIKLSREVDNTKIYTTVWIDKWNKIKKGYRITLKDDPDTWWTVEEIFSTIIDNENIHRDNWGELVDA